MKAQLTIRVPDDLNQEISSLAEKLRLKRSDVARMALEQFAKEFRTESENRPYDRVKDLLGSVSSGIPDLGEAHRKHLIERFKQDA